MFVSSASYEMAFSGVFGCIAIVSDNERVFLQWGTSS